MSLTDNGGYPVSCLANLPYTRLRRFPLAFVVLAAEDQRQGNPVSWNSLFLAESRLQSLSAATIKAVLEV